MPKCYDCNKECNSDKGEDKVCAECGYIFCNDHVVNADLGRTLCYDCGKDEAKRQCKADAPGVWPEWMPQEKTFVAIHHHKHGEDVAIFKYTPSPAYPTPTEATMASACGFDFENDGSEYIECVAIDKIAEIKVGKTF